jgi:hypothetical protein
MVSAVTRTDARSTELLDWGSATTRRTGVVSSPVPTLRSFTVPVMSAGEDGGAEGDGEAG